MSDHVKFLREEAQWPDRPVRASKFTAAADEMDRLQRHEKLCPHWAFRAMAESLGIIHPGLIRARCERYEFDSCSDSNDCITEWCATCFAEKWCAEHVAADPANAAENADT